MKHDPIIAWPIRLAVLAGAILIAWTPARAETPSLSAAQVVAKNVAARGGLAAWQRVHTLAFVGKRQGAAPKPAKTH